MDLSNLLWSFPHSDINWSLLVSPSDITDKKYLSASGEAFFPVFMLNKTSLLIFLSNGFNISNTDWVIELKSLVSLATQRMRFFIGHTTIITWHTCYAMSNTLFIYNLRPHGVGNYPTVHGWVDVCKSYDAFQPVDGLLQCPINTNSWGRVVGSPDR